MMRAVILMACVAFVLSAQGRQVSARVPLVGCAGDGMLGPVEAPQGAALLQNFGVDYFQGFHFGEPLLNPDWD